MLELRDLSAGYGSAPVLRGVSLAAHPGQILCILGRNGAGKTTLMKAIMGLVNVTGGQVTVAGTALSDLPAHRIAGHGVGYVPQGRRLFADLTVAQNLEIGLMVSRGGDAMRRRVLDIFPRLAERMDQRAGTLSGGEQQMLATARALCIAPKVLLLDEPTEGLQPSMIEAIRSVVLRMRDEGVAVVLVEQHVEAVLEIADRVLFLEMGEARETVDIATLRADPSLLTRYVGV